MVKKLLIIMGPTATGKSSLALKLAKKCQAPIINFDSLLFYRELNIGSAKPTKDELSLAKHFFVDIASIKNPLNAADFSEQARYKIEELFQTTSSIIAVGGSGFYLQALLYGMFESLTVSEDVKEKIRHMKSLAGPEGLREYLKNNDPESFQRYHQNDQYRIERAVEHHLMTGTKMSDVRDKLDQIKSKTPLYKNLGWDILPLYLDIDKQQHFEIIQKRTESMIELGLIDEVKDLLTRGFRGEEKPLQSIGYKETLAFLRGEYSREELSERISINTRKLAKAQRTWFSKVEKTSFNPLRDQAKIEKVVEKFFENK